MKCLKEGEARVCPHCNGAGLTPLEKECPRCHGSGQIDIRTVEQQSARSATGPAASPPGCTQTTLATATRSLTRDVLDSTPFTVTQSGRIDITVDWHNAEANVGAFVVQAGSCTAEHFKRSSSFVAQSGNDKPHKMTVNLTAGSYELLLDDFGVGSGVVRNASSETATVQVVESSGC